MMPIPLGSGKKTPTTRPQATPATLTPSQIESMRPQTSLPAGALIAQGRLTDTERKALGQMGWRPGQPIPSGISKELADLEIVQDARELQKRLEVQARDALPLPPNTPPLKVPKPTLLQDLPPAEQQRVLGNIRNTFENTKTLVRAAQEEAKRPQPQFKDPSIGTAVQQIIQQSGADVYVGRPQQPQAEPTPAVVKDSMVQHPAAYLTAHEKERLVNMQPDPQVELPAGTGITNDHPECPHCGWDQSKPEPAENPSYEDKSGFLQSVLGQIRFKKVYPLLEGKLVVVFRTLTSEEADLCMTQTALDMAKTLQMHNDKAFWRTLSDYRLTLSIAAVYIEGRGKIYEAPEDLWSGFSVSEEDKPKDETILPLVVQYLYSKVLVTDSFRKMVGVNFFNFQRMVELMEARVLDPNFWKATEEPT